MFLPGGPVVSLAATGKMLHKRMSYLFKRWACFSMKHNTEKIIDLSFGLASIIGNILMSAASGYSVMLVLTSYM
jgi:hypothetical protein